MEERVSQSKWSKAWWRLRHSKKVESHPMEHLVFFLIGLSLGISYIAQREVVFKPQSPVLGWILIGGIVAIVAVDVKNIIKWVKGKVEKRHL